ncbi:hypothetical protein NRY95_05775 [Xanthomonas campestris pv. phormiicola]|nr:hypothetical protein [Xanthomonas campestris pv. phormiicola]UYC17470.1 hypothetical protein NRY95_05775 [Xanthomonas campestris pv. phormiicola]
MRIDSQADAVGRLDWRAIDDLQGVLSPIELPTEIRGKCLEFMQAMGLDMGCFDFIADRSRNCIFVEVNQQGQFLWLEDYVPSMRVLGEFCEFVVGLSSDASPPSAADSNGIELQAICASHRYAQLMAQLSNRHSMPRVAPGDWRSVGRALPESGARRRAMRTVVTWPNSLVFRL